MAYQWTDALCIDKTDLFFSMDYPKIREAETICQGCPRLIECERQGKYERAGVWGGKLRGWPSESLLRNYAKWLREQKKKEDRLLKAAERMGVDIDQFKRAVGL